MCGIIGFNSPRPLPREEAERFAQSLSNLSDRGSSSCGVALVRGEKVYIRRWLKSSAAPEVKDEVAQMAVGAIMGIGHTRMPSVGEVSLYNAHPLVCGRAIVVHNGSVPGHLAHKMPGDPFVDSYALARMFESGNFRAGLERIKGIEWSGAFLVLSTARPHTLLAVAQNSLDMVIDRASKIIWVLSERDHLQGLLAPGEFPGVDFRLWSSREKYYGSVAGHTLLIGPTTVKDLGAPPRLELRLPPASDHVPDHRAKDRKGLLLGTCFICSDYGVMYETDGTQLCRRCYKEIAT